MHALYTCFDSTHRLNIGCREKSLLNNDIPSSIGHSMKMAFHGINQDKHFIYYHLMHVLMFICDPMPFKISSIGIRVDF